MSLQKKIRQYVGMNCICLLNIPHTTIIFWHIRLTSPKIISSLIADLLEIMCSLFRFFSSPLWLLRFTDGRSLQYYWAKDIRIHNIIWNVICREFVYILCRLYFLWWNYVNQIRLVLLQSKFCYLFFRVYQTTNV